ncbi:MAG TPA: YbhB/YbcL family Raf kinase inhibitor-like protein [Abditibacteriaceae bacterium]|nr:YbhB/YbcL family Raf kinase inhibitor-like protein [Abditibacteriaceae bacterium]
MMLKLLCALLVSAVVLTSCRQPGSTPSSAPSLTPDARKMAIKLQSTAFAPDGMIPEKYTCDGEDVSPPLAWSGVPKAAQSLALIVTDPDATSGTWTHWVMWKLPPTLKEMKENMPPQAKLANGALQGTNDFKKIGYGGPCPPPGSTHRYVFTLYALSHETNLTKVSTADLHDAIEDNVLAEGQLIGKYSR